MLNIFLRYKNMLRLLGAMVFVVVGSAFGMKMTQQAQKMLQYKVTKKQERADQYFLFIADTDDGIWVDKSLVEQCLTLKTMIEDLGGNVKEIPLYNISLEEIKLVFSILQDKNIINTLPFNTLITTANALNFLGVSAYVLDSVMIIIQKNIRETCAGYDQEFKQLNPDLQKKILIALNINNLEDHIIQYVNSKERRKSLGEHSGDISAVAWSPDGKKMVSAGYGNKLLLWNMDTIGKPQSLQGYQNNVLAVAWSPDSKKLVAGGFGEQNNNLFMWDMDNVDKPQPLQGHQNIVRAVAWSPDGKKLVSGGSGKQNNLFLWDMDKIDKPQALPGHSNDVYAVAWSPDGKKLISGSRGSQNNLLLWNMDNVSEPQSLQGHSNDVYAVAWSPDGKKLVFGGYGSNLFLWDMNNIDKPQVLPGHSYKIFTVAWSSDGKRLVSGGQGGENNLLLWDMDNVGKFKTLQGDLYNVRAVAWSPDGNKLIAGSDGKQNNLLLWTLFTDKESNALKMLRNCSVEQLQLIYHLSCSRMKRNNGLSSIDDKIFNTLPQDIQTLLKYLGLTNK